jgi:hypothetical protein
MSSAGDNKPLAWITGANGLIGNYLVQTAPQSAPGWRVRRVARADFDLLILQPLNASLPGTSRN